MVALKMSIPKMMNAFVLVCLGDAIYAIVGVTFFKDLDPTDFGDFFTAMFTLFQVRTLFLNHMDPVPEHTLHLLLFPLTNLSGVKNKIDQVLITDTPGAIGEQ